MKNITFKRSSANSASEVHHASCVIFTVLLLIIFTFYSVKIQAQWINVGSPGFSASGDIDFPDIAFEGSTPYVAFTDFGIGQKAVVMKFDGINWVTVGNPGFSGQIAGDINLAFIGSIPYVSINTNGGITVMKYNGTDWVNVGSPNISNGEAQDMSFAIKDSTPFVVFSDFNFGHKSSVMKYDGTDWVYVGSPGFSESEVWYLSLDFNDLTPYVAFRDFANDYKSTVMKFDGSNWVNVGSPGFSNGDARYLSLAIDDSIPYLAFQDYGNGAKASVMKYNGTNWVYTGNPSFSDGEVQDISLAFTANTPYMAFCDLENDYKASVMKFTGNDWIYVGSRGFSAGSTLNEKLAFYGSTPFVVYANEHKVTVMKFEDTPLPVELAYSNSTVSGNTVSLNWSTVSETNNSGFDIERAIKSIDNGQLTIDNWSKIGNVNGNGTINEPREYSFTDRNLSSGKYKYRLKQIDYNGNFEYFNLSNEVNIGVPSNYSLSQNYPNPFNPTTNLEFGISQLGFVSLKIYDISGKEVATLVNEVKPAGYYTVNFNAAELSSGVYYYSINSNGFSATKKMLLIK